MNQQPSNQQPLFTVPPRPPRNHRQMAATFGGYVVSFVQMVLYGLVALVTCAAAYVVIRIVLWGARAITRALGV